MKTIRLLRPFSSKPATAPKTYTLEELKSSKFLNFNLTSDIYRMDFGLLVQRPPIFTPIERVEVDKMNTVSKFMYKHGLRDPIPKELLDFELSQFSADDVNKGVNNNVTHEKRDNQGNFFFYRGNSKYYREVDPTIKDVHSIQSNPHSTVYLFLKEKEGEWTVPYAVPEDHQSADIAFSRLKSNLLGG